MRKRTTKGPGIFSDLRGVSNTGCVWSLDSKPPLQRFGRQEQGDPFSDEPGRAVAIQGVQVIAPQNSGDSMFSTNRACFAQSKNDRRGTMDAMARRIRRTFRWAMTVG